VSYESNRGFYVREFSTADVAGAFLVRAELEALACRLAAGKITEEASAKLAEFVADGDTLLSPGHLAPDNLGPYRRMNVAFHNTIIQVSANPWIKTFVDSLHNVPLASDRLIMWREYDVLLRSHDDHHRIARALSAGDGERAAAIMREHITFAHEHLQGQLEKYPGDFLRVPTSDARKTRARNKRTDK